LGGQLTCTPSKISHKGV